MERYALHTRASSDVSTHTTPSLVIFSGGTAFNETAFELHKWSSRVAYVLPVSDDGGSTAEIVRVIGGPALGDIRSRCLRLSNDETREARAVRNLLGHRLHSEDDQEAKLEWYSIVEGSHALWEDVGDPYKHTIRAFLVHFQGQILSRDACFSFRNGSIGNFFFAGARTFFKSIEAAIFLYARVSGIPKESRILPAIVTYENQYILGCELENGQVIRGQNEISHPSTMTSQVVCKGHEEPLPSPIKRIFYLSTESEHFDTEIYPRINKDVVESLHKADVIVFGMGSLYTSICPSLILLGVGEAIQATHAPKVFLLNGALDRETGNMTAVDFVLAATNTLNRRHSSLGRRVLNFAPNEYINVLVYPEGTIIDVNVESLLDLGIQTKSLASEMDPKIGVSFSNVALRDYLLSFPIG